METKLHQSDAIIVVQGVIEPVDIAALAFHQCP
jgi:hypothetical protein